MRRPHEVRLFYRNRWVAADLRPWGLGRPTLRDPDAAHWPIGGERTDSLAVGQEWVGAYLQTVHRIHLRQRVLPRKLKAALLEFARHRETAVEASTQSTDTTVAGHLLEHFRDAPVHDVSPGLQGFADYLGRRGYEPSTIRTYMGAACAFLVWADLPVPAVKLPTVPQQEARFWTDPEIARLREAADYGSALHRRALELVLATGARQQELFALEWQQFSEAARAVRIVQQLDRNRTSRRKPLKGKRARTALVLPAWWRYIDEAVPDWRSRIGLVLPGRGHGGAMYRPGQERIIRDILHAARLREPGVAWHTGRHTYGRLGLEGGMSIEQLRVFLGHKSITTTDQTYGHLTEQAAVRLAREQVFGSA